MGHGPYLRSIYTRIALETYGPLPVRCRCGELIYAISAVDGCVHHRDENPRNNTPENLEIIHHTCHTSHHKKGFSHTEETRLRISETMTGRTFTDEHRTNLSRALKGRVFTDEWRANIGRSSRERVQKRGRCSCGWESTRAGVANHAKASGHTWERI